MNPDIVREGQELVARLRAERDEARQERDEHMTGKGRLQQRLADAEQIMNRLAGAPALAAAAHPGCVSDCTHTRDRAEKIADPERFDRTREKLKAFKNQLFLKTSGNTTRFPNVQHKMRYAYQFLASGHSARCAFTSDEPQPPMEKRHTRFSSTLSRPRTTDDASRRHALK